MMCWVLRFTCFLLLIQTKWTILSKQAQAWCFLQTVDSNAPWGELSTAPTALLKFPATKWPRSTKDSTEGSLDSGRTSDDNQAVKELPPWFPLTLKTPCGESLALLVKSRVPTSKKWKADPGTQTPWTIKSWHQRRRSKVLGLQVPRYHLHQGHALKLIKAQEKRGSMKPLPSRRSDS